MQAAARRRYLPYDKYHGNIKPRSRNACLQGHFCSAVELRSRAKARKRQSRPDFAQGKIPSILNHEVKMLACKGIFTRPSMSHRAAICRTGGSMPPILAIRQVSWEYYTTKRKCVLAQTFSRGRQCHIVRQSAARAALRRRYLSCGKYHGNIIPRSENVCLHGHFREAVNVTSCGNLPPILAMRQVSWEYYTTKRKCVLAQTFSRGRQCHIVRQSAARAALRRRYLPCGKYHVNIITYPPLYCKLFLLCNSPCGLDTVNNSGGDAHRKLPPVHRVAKARCFLRI